MSRQKYEPTPEERRQVLSMTGYGIQQTEIARLLDIDAKTLRLYFRDELDTGMTQANMRVAQALYKNAVTNENVAAQIWWTKTRMGWKEARDVNITGAETPSALHLLAARLVSEEIMRWRGDPPTIQHEPEHTVDLLDQPPPLE